MEARQVDTGLSSSTASRARNSSGSKIDVLTATGRIMVKVTDYVTQMGLKSDNLGQLGPHAIRHI